MTDNDVRWIIDDHERWMQTRVRIEGPGFDASVVTPGVRSLGMKAVGMPDGELAKLEGLESLVINGGSAERIDLRGCTSLRHLAISHVRGLTELVGIEELTTLEELDLYALPRIESVPPLERLARLWRPDLGSMKGLAGGLAPFLAAPNLREVQLASTLVIAPGDAELLRDHPRVVGFSWWDSRGTPAADVRDLFDTAGRRPALMRKFGRPPEHEVPPQRVAELAPEHMVQIQATCRGDRGDGGVHPLSGLGDVLLEGEHDYGPGLRQIRITLCQGARRPDGIRIRLQRAKGVLAIELPSDLPEERFHQVDASPALFEQGAREVVAALEAARARVAEELPEFAVDALLDRVREASRRLPTTPDNIDGLIDSAGLRARTLRVAMNRLREQAGKNR